MLRCAVPTASGGYLGVNLAAKHPDVIKGLILLNATPFWSQRPPAGQETLLWQLLNIDASLPVKHVRKPSRAEVYVGWIVSGCSAESGLACCCCA